MGGTINGHFCAAQGSAQHMQHEPGRQRCMSAAEAARMLHEAVQSAVSRASREAQYLKRSDAFPRLQMQLQISGGLLAYNTADSIYAMMLPP